VNPPRMGCCACDQAPQGPTNARQRAARAVAGVTLLALTAAATRASSPFNVALAGAAGWVGVSHLVAAATGYNGCPELGAIPTVVRGHPVHTRCGPWQTLDRRLGLVEPSRDRAGG
jgi:hypothetical protein